MKFSVINSVSFLIVIMTFSGCNWFNKKKVQPPTISEMEEEQDEVLLSIGGKPVITAKKFKNHLQKIVAANPQIKGVLESVPAVKYNVFSGMVGQELLREWATEQGINKEEEYQRDYTMALQLVEYELARKYFTESLHKEIKVTKEEINRYYQAHKDTIPDMVIEPGGVKALGVAFKNGIESAAFVQYLGKNQNRFKEAVLSEKLTSKDFGLVTSYTVDIDKTIKKSVLAMQNQQTRLISVKAEDGTFWVCYADAKKDPEYRPLEDVKEGIENSLKQEKLQVAYGSKVEALKTVYRAQENKEYFEVQNTQELLAQQEQDEKDLALKKPATRVA